MDEFNKDPMLMSALKGELEITAAVQSPYTVKMMGSKIGQKFTYMILELCDLDLRKELASKKLT